ncbi:alkyl sulfatase BDS1-like metallo-beta-lactamase superfamily hydrolase [Murinocardiopsis flavida]|uniref:Linear primary-alkylsulfatase n=1 Tax=Murinocardiopsis flavida TaxID=645275 RepID=A0A2P8CPP2_9ACTN|nr:alkyl sulfatase dimerization domain-containing protein [Murinocardiopsis flavida]PSK86936.1 alkyl sulfatase BDS1-like metallo-beta-lactamase superfamily hydrolase [Murinocardiopsis flavida]
MALPSFSDRSDFDDADRGFIATLAPATISGPDGNTVWDGDAYNFLDGECPDTANPSLWRQGRLVAKQGLYQVTDGIYQVRGLDLSNITFVEGRTGVIVIDPLISTETARAALGLYREHRGERAVSAVVYTHSHVDHFGGVRGVVPDGADTPVYAPAGFMEHAVSENVYAGIAMARRSIYMYGAELAKGPAGQIGCGLGMTTSTGTISLIPPTVDITATGQEEVIDGVRVVFQITPGTEAPSEMNFLFPDHRALCMAENATHNLHNLLTLRGAVVRNPHTWAHYLTEAVALFGDRADVLFASHHWPTFGRANLVAFLREQRDLYAYLHDQTLRGINSGMTGIEIAEAMELPPTLERAWHARGYYGSVSHNVKAIYQHYMGWFDGNPAHLWEHPPVESAKRYVEFMGGADAVLRKAEDSFAAGDLRWVAQVVNHVVFAEPGNQDARDLLARAYERLGYGAENGPWRNFYLQGAQELRGNLAEQSIDTTGPDMAAALTVDQIFDSLAVRVDGPGCWDERLSIDWTFTDLGQSRRTTLANGVLVTQPVPSSGEPAGLSVALTVPQLLQAVSTGGLDGTRTEGDTGLLRRILGALTEPDRSFPIVTP